MKGNRLVILSNKTGEGFAGGVAAYIGAELIGMDLRDHPDGEVYCRIRESIRGADVFYVCPYYPDPKNRHTENLIALGTIEKASAGRVTMVPTYLGFQRSDWKDEARVAIAIQDVARSIESVGTDRVLTMHLHAPQIQGIFRIPMDVLEALHVSKEWYDEKGVSPNDIVVVAADTGGTKYAERFAGVVGVKKLGTIWKKRTSDEDVDTHGYAGDPVEGKIVLMPEDQLSTGTSMRKGAKRLKEQHGAKSVYGFVTHGIFAPKKTGGEMVSAEDLLMEDDYLDGVAITDTIPRIPEWKDKYKSRIEVRSVVKNFGDAIKRIHMNESLEGLFQY